MATLPPFRPEQPIGIFDSGIGGLTVANAIAQRLPQETLCYFGDTAHLPYGDKSADAIRYYCLKITKFLLEQDAKMIVIACNSASTAAYEVLLDFFHGRALFVNVVDPLVETIAREEFSKVGIIATKATIRSGVYESLLAKYRPDIKVHALATPLLAPMIEEGYAHSRISRSIIEDYLSDPGFRDIDALMLACTHYPLIRQEIEEFFDGKVRVYDSTEIVAEAVAAALQEQNLLNNSKKSPDQFYVSDFTPSFAETTRIFYGHEVHLKHCPLW